MGELSREEAAGAPLGWALVSQTLLKFCANALCKWLNSQDKAIRVSQPKATKLRMLKFQAKTEIFICHEVTWTRLRPEANPYRVLGPTCLLEAICPCRCTFLHLFTSQMIVNLTAAHRPMRTYTHTHTHTHTQTHTHTHTLPTASNELEEEVGMIFHQSTPTIFSLTAYLLCAMHCALPGGSTKSICTSFPHHLSLSFSTCLKASGSLLITFLPIVRKDWERYYGLVGSYLSSIWRAMVGESHLQKVVLSSTWVLWHSQTHRVMKAWIIPRNFA